MTLQHFAEAICLAFAACGSVYVLLCVATAAVFRQRMARAVPLTALPPATIFKPLYGVDKDLLENLRSACRQDYPGYQVVLSVQRLDDPAIPVMHQILAEFGPERVTLAIAESAAHTNGKIQNLEGAYPFARHDVFVISDSDICLRPDYLRAIVAPLADPAVGCVSTPYRAMNAAYWFEKLELLTMNADFVPNLIFASVAGIVTFGLGASMCFRRKDLEAIGGFAAFGEHLAEDSHMAARLEALGRRVVLAPYFVDMEVDLKSFSQWWEHQLYWDQNTRVVRPAGFFATVVVRSVPFAFLYAILTGLSLAGLGVAGAAVAIRMAGAAFLLRYVLKDREGLAALWLLPLRDLFGLAVWLLAITRCDFMHRGRRFGLLADGRIVPRPAR
ncbi:MAG: glycosyltransferase [Rhizomicrobium sp.]